MSKRLTTGMVILLLGMGSAQAFDAPSTTLSTPEIMASFTPDPSCLNYCVTGVCVWLKCSLTGCRIRTSPRVSHYNPDLVVSVYDQPGNNPWAEAEWLIGHWEKQMANVLVGLFHGTDAGGGHRTEGGNTSTDQSLRFKEATAMGHPLSSLSQVGGQTGLFCPSEATAFVPYFSSSFDSLTWRLGLPEMLYLYNLLPGRRVVGAGIWQQWGSVWPRTGFINQKDDAKAAAVVAQRVGNIVTQSHQPHMYVPLRGNGFSRTWLPGELVENDARTGVWQMLAPKQERQCAVFGENDVMTTAWSQGRQSEDNRYAFALWRPYECCKDKGSYLYTIPLRMCL